MLKKLFYTVVFLAIGFLTTTTANQIKAQIEIEVDRDYTLSRQGVMNVSEKETLFNTFTDRFIPGGTERKYFFVISAQSSTDRQKVADQIYNSLKVDIAGTAVNYKKIKENNNFGISYVLSKRLNPSERQAVTFQYTHPELGAKVGGLMDAYIPAFSENFEFELQNTKYTYRTRLKIPSESGDENIVSVAPASKFKENGFDVYVFDQNSLIGSFVWVQRGSQQVYKFKIKQQLSPTTNKNNGSLDEYRMVIPRDIEEEKVQQKVYITRITPKPVGVTRDDNGNVIGIFRTDAYKKTTITIEGYALLTNKNNKKVTTGGELSEINKGKMAKYLQTGDYWEVSADAISKKRQEVVKNEDDVYKITAKLYTNIIDSIDYSEVKRFGINERQGALKTLAGGAAVCMEYSDLFLTLSRNAGVPARAAFGYGYDSRLPANSQEAHQWVQVYLPKYDSWISVDVTWGEAGPLVIGGDLNHFFTHIAAKNPDDPSILSRLSITPNNSELVSPEFEVDVLAKLPVEAEKGMTIDQLFEKYPDKSGDNSYYLANLENKFSKSLSNLFRNPGDIDVQGWFVLSIFGLGILLVMGGSYKGFLEVRELATRFRKGNVENPVIVEVGQPGV